MTEIRDMYLKQHPDAASRIIENEAIILVPDNGMLHTLNSVGTRIWELANGKKTVSDIIHRLSEEFDADKETISEDAVDFIEDMLQKKILLLSSGKN